MSKARTETSHRRRVLAFALALVMLALVPAGAYLVALGGSPYYLIAGLAVGLSAFWAWHGDERSLIAYAALLIGTLLWAVWESGVNAWALQARMAAPLVLGFWVLWPWLARIPRANLGLVAVAAIGLAGYGLSRVDRVEPAGHPATMPTAKNIADHEWRAFGGSLAGGGYSALDQIAPANIGQLDLAWTYKTGVTVPSMGFSAQPIMIDDLLYFCTPNNLVIALDPETGQRRWQFDPQIASVPPSASCRGVSHFTVPNGSGACAERIIFGTSDARLMAVDARTGISCADFGIDGAVDLKRGMGDVPPGTYYVSSPPMIADGKAVIGGWVSDNLSTDMPSGVIRAFDATSGKLAWAWDMDNPELMGEPDKGQTYSRGSANSWGLMSADEELGLVYVPTGNGSPDYFGAFRKPGTEKYASSVVALDVKTGRPRWSFQTVHHDLWDYDVMAKPVLIDLTIGGEQRKALIQTSKRGQIFILDRVTGKPLARIEERPVPQGAVAGDRTSLTQPFSTEMPSFDDTVLTEAMMWGVTPIDQLWCRIRFAGARYDGPLTPPGLEPTILYPSYLGGQNWGGVSIDPERRLMFVNWIRMANYTRLLPRDDPEAIRAGKEFYHEPGKVVSPQEGTPYAVATGAFLSPLNIPCNEPPFGKIAVVDLDKRKIVWEKPFGTSRDAGPFGLTSNFPLPMGVPNQGGALTLRSGVVFIAATQERMLRAFELQTGKLLWKYRLPAGGHTIPMTYVSPKSKRQFVVLPAGGSLPLLSGVGDSLMAFALPQKNP